MATYNELYLRARAAGMNDETARQEAMKLAGMSTQAQPHAAPRPAPRDVLTERGFDARDAARGAQLARDMDPQRAAHAQRELARIDAELETVNAQIAALEQRRRELVEAKRPYLFTG